MNSTFYIIAIYVLLLIGFMSLFKVNPFVRNRRISLSGNILKAKREGITRPGLKRGARLIIKLDIALARVGWTMREFALLLATAFLGGTAAGFLLFGDLFLSLTAGVVFTPLAYLFLTFRAMKASRREVESLENTMSVITNAYLSTDDIVRAVEVYIQEKNRYIPLNQRASTPFDEFVAEVMFVNSDVERALHILSAKYNNKYFDQWIRMLILCHNDRNLKFGLHPIIAAMTDAKTMQVENDTQMAVVWRDYFLTAGLMFSIVPVLRFSNAEWFDILTNTPGGKLLMVLMLLAALLTSFYVLRINKPVNAVD